MSDTLFALPKLKGLRRPKAKVDGATKPVWVKYQVKTPVRCDHCVLVAYETAIGGGSFQGIRQAVQKRSQDGEHLHLCYEHAKTQRDEDESRFGDLPGSQKQYRRRYIS